MKHPGPAAGDGALLRLARLPGAPSAALLEVLEPCVQDLFSAVELGAPEVAHVIEARVDGIEARVHAVKPFILG